jgi:hypothetical protein
MTVVYESNLRDVIRAGSSRGLDFVKEEELNLRTGIAASEVVPFTVSEEPANSLDKDATEIRIDVQRNSQFDIVAGSDNGSKKLTRSDLKLILGFENKASSKRGFVRVSRGCLGNALKCVFGYSYALAEKKGLPQYPGRVASGKFEFRNIVLKPDKVREKIDYDFETVKRIDDGFTVVEVGFPIERTVDDLKALLKKLVFAMHMVNPGRLITYNLYGDKGTLGEAQENKVTEHETVASWYTPKQFNELFEDFARTEPETQAKDFIGLFKWFSRKSAQRDVCLELNMIKGTNCTANVDSQTVGSVQIVPSTPLKDFSSQAIENLFDVMKSKSKPIHKRSIPSLLGFVGKENFERISQQHGWAKPRYICLAGTKRICPEPLHFSSECKNPDHVEFPYLVELAFYDRGDKEGLQVYQAVNFMSSTHDLFASTFNVMYRLGKVGLSPSSSVTIVVHLVTPVQPWLNYGKRSIGNIDSDHLMEQAFDKLLPIPKTPREYHPPPPPRPLSWVPHGKLGDLEYEEKLRFFAAEMKAIDARRTYVRRPRMRGWGYLIAGLGLIHKGEFAQLANCINDCRKMGEKHGGLPMDFIAPDPDESRRFKGIHRASNPKVFLEELRKDMKEMLESLPSNITDFYAGEKYYLMMVCEKGEIFDIVAGPICKGYFVPHVSSKGWSNLEIRANIAKQCLWAITHGLTPVLLLFYDLDPKGKEISDAFRKNLKDMERATGFNPDSLIIERIGLNKDQVDKFGLLWIENLKTSKGREIKRTRKVLRYIDEIGERKCEIESLFKNDETLRAAEQIFREAIEKYYGPDARERFIKKELESKGKLHDVYDSPVWSQLDAEITRIEEAFGAMEPKTEPTTALELEKELEVLIDDKFYAKCPKCGTSFNDEVVKPGTLVRCRSCYSLIKIVFPNISLEERKKMFSLFINNLASAEALAGQYGISEKQVLHMMNEMVENDEKGTSEANWQPLVGTDEEYATHVRKALEQQLEQQEEITETKVEMLRLFLQGKATLKQLAATYEVTEEQVTQILAEMNLSPDASTNHA